MTKKFEGKVALVTGGNSGMGKAAALAFSKAGAKVIIAARRVREGEDTVKKIKAEGGEAIFVKTDVSMSTEVEALVRKAVQTYGRLDYAFNNAAVTPEKFRVPVVDQTEEEFDRIISINLKGVWLCLKYEIAQMLNQGGGAIVITSSTGGLHGGTFNTSAYHASKYGVIGLAKAAAMEYAKAGIRVNVVCPGAIQAPMLENAMAQHPELEQFLTETAVPMGRIGMPEDIANAVIWLCSDESSYVTGKTIVVDGGMLT